MKAFGNGRASNTPQSFQELVGMRATLLHLRGIDHGKDLERYLPPIAADFAHAPELAERILLQPRGETRRVQSLNRRFCFLFLTHENRRWIVAALKRLSQVGFDPRSDLRKKEREIFATIVENV
jgi:hypothetical protein